jgi:class 3 adenylate cyclase
LVVKVDNLIQLRLAQKDKEYLNRQLEENIKKINDVNAKVSKYLSPQLYSSIFEGKQSGSIESKRKKLTIFFSDIKNFTKITEDMESEDLTMLLNSYLTEMSIIALKYGATIDKFIGDAILIFFGDPESKGIKEDALACISMAMEMKNKMQQLRYEWQIAGFVQPFEIRVGINTGYCTVGNFGSEYKMDYTVIGSNVNLASRLESSANVGEILISEETYMLVKDEIDCIAKDKIEVKGFEQLIQTYQIKSLKKRDIVTESKDGFYINIDFDRIDDKELVSKVLHSLVDKLDSKISCNLFKEPKKEVD